MSVTVPVLSSIRSALSLGHLVMVDTHSHVIGSALRVSCLESWEIFSLSLVLKDLFWLIMWEKIRQQPLYRKEASLYSVVSDTFHLIWQPVFSWIFSSELGINCLTRICWVREGLWFTVGFSWSHYWGRDSHLFPWSKVISKVSDPYNNFFCFFLFCPPKLTFFFFFFFFWWWGVPRIFFSLVS